MKNRPPLETDDFDYSEMSRVADRLLTPVAVIGPDTTLQYANEQVARIVEIDVAHLVGRRMLDFVHPDDQERVGRELAEIAGRDPHGGFSRFRLRGHEEQGWRVVDAYAHNLMDDPAVRGILISGGDVTEKENLSRALKSFSDVTRILIHAKDEKSLMSAVCDSIIDNGEYLVAWVGYAVSDEAKTVQAWPRADSPRASRGTPLDGTTASSAAARRVRRSARRRCRWSGIRGDWRATTRGESRSKCSGSAASVRSPSSWTNARWAP